LSFFKKRRRAGNPVPIFDRDVVSTAKFMKKQLKSHVVHMVLLLLIAGGQLHADTTWQRVQKKGVLTICADPDNLPYSSSDPKLPGIDIEAAQLLAEALGVTLKFHWIDTLVENPLVDLSLRKHCDCALGIAIEERAMEEEIEVGKRVDYSTPYAGTGYILVAQAEQQPTTIKKLEGIKTQAIGAEAGSVAGDVLKRKGYNRRLYPSQVAVLSALQQGQIAYGVLWANAGWLIEKGPPNAKGNAGSVDRAYPNLKLVDGYVPEPGFRWNVAVAVRKGDEDFKNAINAVIQEKLTGEQMKKICEKYQVPYYLPFNQTEE